MVFVKMYLSSDLEIKNKLGDLGLYCINYVKKRKGLKTKVSSVEEGGDNSTVSQVRLKYHSKRSLGYFSTVF